MLNCDEEDQVRQILKFLEPPDIVQLAKTVTSYKLDPKSTEEAIDFILRYERSFESFLQHKKVSCEVLFRFMHLQKIPVLPKDDKRTMITKIINFLENLPKKEDTHQDVSASSSESTQQSDQSTYIGRTVNDFALEFSNWFYSMMNQENRIGMEHFWIDCNIRVCVFANGDTINNSIANSAQESVNLLWDVKMQYGLFFNPNITLEGVRGIVGVHGLLIVLVCGTLHKEQKCVGIFEQRFGLIRDPTSQNNWKIKYTELFLRSTDAVKTMPTLQDSQHTSNNSTI